MAGFYTGRKGSLYFTPEGGSETRGAKVRDWSIQTTVELLSTNDIGSSYNTFTPGIVGATGSATLIYYRPTEGESSFSILLGKIMKKGVDASVTSADRVELELNVGTRGYDDIKFYAYITSATVSISNGELVVVPFQFTVDGEFSQIIKLTDTV